MAGYVPDGHGPTALTATYATIIASDGTNVHVLRTIEVVNTSVSVRTVFVSIGVGAAATEIIEISVPANDTVTRNLWLVVPLSTVVQAKQGTGTDCTITIGALHYT